jgi:hypothetical protein
MLRRINTRMILGSVVECRMNVALQIATLFLLDQHTELVVFTRNLGHYILLEVGEGDGAIQIE